MTEAYQDRVIQGDCLAELRKLPSELADVSVTSPPYWGLRDYGEQNVTVWGGKADCEHQWVSREYFLHNGRGDAQKGAKFSEQESIPDVNKSDDFCVLCGAWKGQLGLEPHPSMFISHLVEIFGEVKRVLKKSGSCWVVLGDSYFGGGRGQNLEVTSPKQFSNRGSSYMVHIPPPKSDGSSWLQPKQKLLIPERFAIAMQESGWILRNAVVWHKQNHMPESVTDRLTRSYETVYFFVKSKRYYFDLEAVRRPHIWAKRDKRSLLRRVEGKSGKITENHYATNAVGYNPLGANPGDCWTLTTEAFKGAHFATFPTKLVKRILLCACPKEGLVLDPFAGSGTTLYVARKMALHYIGIELNPAYAELAKKRLKVIPARLEPFLESPLIVGTETKKEVLEK